MIKKLEFKMDDPKHLMNSFIEKEAYLKGIFPWVWKHLSFLKSFAGKIDDDDDDKKRHKINNSTIQNKCSFLLESIE